MVKNYFNLVFFIIIVTIFLFFLCSPDIHGFRTPLPTPPNRQNRLFVTSEQPYYITPSNIRIVQPELTPSIKEDPTKNGFFVGRGSPTGSISASTILGIPTEFPHQPVYHQEDSFNLLDNQVKNNIVSVDILPKNQPFEKEKVPLSIPQYFSFSTKSLKKKKEEFYNFVNSNETKKRESVGERICRRIFNRFISMKLGRNKEAMGPIRPRFLKNPKTGYNLEIDIFEPFDDKVIDKNDIQDGIGIEYNGLQHDQFVPWMHEDNDAFLDQQYRDKYKAKICKERGIILIVIDTKIDISRIQSTTKKGKRKYINFSEEQREANLEPILIPLLEDAYNQLMKNRNDKRKN